MRDAAATAARTSASAQFTTQVSGLTVMLGTVRERAEDDPYGPVVRRLVLSHEQNN